MCRGIYRKFKPDAVLGMGGFTSTPPVLAARRLRIPAFIHESNAIPGKANRFSARFSAQVFLGFEEAAEYFRREDCVFTGTPVRESIGQRIPREEAMKIFGLDPSKKTLLVMGGSQGAAGINQMIFRVAGNLAKQSAQIIHFTGERDDRLAAANYMRETLPAYVATFHERMQEAYSAADLVVSRAGASSLNELGYFGLASIQIPYPFAADNHQEANAKIFVRRGAAEMVLETDPSPGSFALLVENLLEDDSRREKMGAAAANIQPKDAAIRVADLLERKVSR